MSLLQEDYGVEGSTTRKLHWHIMSRFCLLTVLNHVDRANLVILSVPLPHLQWGKRHGHDCAVDIQTDQDF